jgi:hypothetical protein
MVSSVSVRRARKINGTTGHAGDWVDQGEAILSSEKSIKTPINSHYFLLGVKDD